MGAARPAPRWHEGDRPPSPRELLDQTLAALVDAVLGGDPVAARRAFADALAFDLGTAGHAAECWVERERVRAAALSDDVEREPSAYVRGGAT